MYTRISRYNTGRASAIFNTNRQVVSSFGVATFATILTDRTASRVGDALQSASAYPPPRKPQSEAAPSLPTTTPTSLALSLL